jgi:hypothetical protein
MGKGGSVSQYYAFVGKMKTGKTTISKMLVEDHDYERFSFATPVKYQAMALVNHFLTWNKSDKRISLADIERDKTFYRPLLQYVGTQLGRELVDDNIWIDAFKESFRAAEGSGPSFKAVIDDCRFVNEAEALRELGFKIIKLKRDETERVRTIRQELQHQVRTVEELETALEAILTHPSEAEVDKINADVTLFIKDEHGLNKVAELVGTATRSFEWADANEDGEVSEDELRRWEGEGGGDD